MCPGLRTSPWAQPTLGGSFQPHRAFPVGLAVALCPHFSPELAAGFLGPMAEFTLCKERNYEVGMAEGGPVFSSFGRSPSLAPPSQIFTSPSLDLRRHHLDGLPADSWDTPSPARWTIRDCVPYSHASHRPQPLRLSQSTQNLSMHHWARTLEERKEHLLQ